MSAVAQLQVELEPGADLRGQSLCGRDLRGVDLSRADLTGAELREADLRGARMFECKLDGADLTGANLAGADLTAATATGAGLGNANLDQALLFSADLSSATLTGSSLINADLRRARLEKARVFEADLRGADLAGAVLRDADLRRARVERASFRAVDLAGSRLRELSGYEQATWLEARLEGADFNGAYLLRRYIMDENYLYEFRHRGPLSAAIYRVWWLTSDCGRSFLRWAFWTFLLALAFAAAYGATEVDYGPHESWISPVYYSVVTLTTLGYGDVTPVSVGAKILAMGEVFLGYVMLGGLLSIFANKMARRAG